MAGIASMPVSGRVPVSVEPDACAITRDAAGIGRDVPYIAAAPGTVPPGRGSGAGSCLTSSAPCRSRCMEPEATDTLVRAARELLRWDQKLLAEKAKVGVATVRRFETGAQVGPEIVEAISRALRKAGVAFIGPHRPPPAR